MELIVTIATLALFVLAVGKLCSRLLGVRLGVWRGVTVGALGWTVGAAAVLFVFGDDTNGGRTVEIDDAGRAVVAIAILLFFGVLAAMPIAIALDLLTRRTGVRRRRSWRDRLHPVRAIHRRLAPYGRLREVAANARRANLLHLRFASRAALETPEFAARLRAVLEESGGMLVKFGQIASTRTDSLPEALTSELAGLQADVRPITADQVRAVIEAELGEPVEQAFASFDFEPMAAASIGQTHRAVLTTGEPVVVKVQRPGITEVVGRDAAMLRLAAAQLERRVEAARAVGLAALCEELIAGVEEELDYRLESSAGMRLREHRADDLGIAVPRVFPSLSTERVLVMEEVKGRSIGDATALDTSPVDRPELARRLLKSFLGQVLEDGMFHADPHPGNLFIDADGTIWMIDFGSVGRLDPLAMDGLRGVAIGVASRDTSVLGRAVRDLSSSDGLTDLHALEADLGSQLTSMDASAGLDPKLITDILRVMDRHGLRPPPAVTLLGRALLTLDGSLHLVDQGFDFAGTSTELVAGEQMEMLGTPDEILKKEALRALPALRTLPEQIETLGNQLRAGKLSVRTERYAGNDRVVVDGWVDRGVIAAIGCFGALASALLIIAGTMVDEQAWRNAFFILGLAGLSFATVLMMRSAARALRRLPIRIE